MHQSRTQRADIQALRGVAVLAVVLFHAKLGSFDGGYLGVDIFFVLSGFLITTLIKEAVEQNRFSYKQFLGRRARRLLPAALTTFFLTALCAPFFLASEEMADFRQQLFGALTFSANVVLNSQSGYFGGAAELKPLLHIWSLSIEEQYYFILPAFFLVLSRRFWLPALVIAAIASLSLCYLEAGQASTFWLLPSRAWELLIGSVGAFLTGVPWIRTVATKTVWIGLVGLAVSLALPVGSYHPGPQALLVCLATLAIILAQHPALQRGAFIAGLHWLGNLSYSLYLVHWPIFAFYKNVYFGDEHRPMMYLVRGGLVGLSLAIAWLMHRYVEQPLRHGVQLAPVRFALGCAAVGSLSVGLAIATQFDASTTDYAFLRRPNTGLAPVCSNKSNFTPIAACQSAPNPKLLVWGDSYAMHLVPGLVATPITAASIVQATRSRCGPLLGMAGVEYRSQEWARDCIRFNDDVLAYLRATPEIRTVVLSSPLDRYVRGTDVLDRVAVGNTPVLHKGGLDQTAAALERTVHAIRQLGRDVVLIGPPPSSGFHVARCHERRERGLWTTGVDPQCRVPVADYHRSNRRVLDLLDRLEKNTDVPVVRLDRLMCGATYCETSIGNVMLYQDAGHLSYAGSIALLKHPAMQAAVGRSLRDSATAALKMNGKALASANSRIP